MNSWEKYRYRNDFEEDASFEVWEKIYVPVYSNIDVFRENFDFNKPLIKSGKINRLAIPARKEGYLFENYSKKLKLYVPEDFTVKFLLSGDTDINVSGKECHRLENYSLMPITGALNNEKGKKGLIQDDLPQFIYFFSDIVNDPTAYNGRYKRSLYPYRKEMVKCARQAYYELFHSDIYEYCRKVYFYDINDAHEELYQRTNKLINDIIKNKGIYPKESGEFADVFWTCRRDILKEKYGINL